jgi:hypothetical protein
MQDWLEIPDFPGYSVNSEGIVRNDSREKPLARMVNQQGVGYVCLVREGVQHKRSVGQIVANVFLPPPPNRHFNTPIYLDGDKLNAAASNLMWRPKWFAMRYHKQFEYKLPVGGKPIVPVEEVSTLEQFSDIWIPVMLFGLIWNEIYTAAWNFTHQGSYWASVWPTDQQFRLL